MHLQPLCKRVFATIALMMLCTVLASGLLRIKPATALADLAPPFFVLQTVPIYLNNQQIGQVTLSSNNRNILKAEVQVTVLFSSVAPDDLQVGVEWRYVCPYDHLLGKEQSFGTTDFVSYADTYNNPVYALAGITESVFLDRSVSKPH